MSSWKLNKEMADENTLKSLCSKLQRILTPRRHLWPCFNIWRFRRPL